jgi:hypothetical protein
LNLPSTSRESHALEHAPCESGMVKGHTPTPIIDS